MAETKWNLQEGDEIVPGRHALQLLGGGHRYEAYLAWDDHLYSIVVAKLLRPNLVDDVGSRKGLRAEADILKMLHHPVLLRCFEICDEPPRPHLVLEHLEGPRLSTLMRKQKRLSLEQAISLGLQLCSALVYMHNEGFVHLDVKPRNIIMSGPPRLIDMSVARSFLRAIEGIEPIGTDAYMAPEQCRPRVMGGMGPKSDVWGWGATMYEAVSGNLPFPRPSEKAVGERERFPQLEMEPDPLPRDIPPELGDVIMSCLAKRPEHRPRQTDVARALEPLAAALPRRIVLSRFRPR